MDWWQYLANEWALCSKPFRVLSIGPACVKVKLLQAAEKLSESLILGTKEIHLLKFTP